ncbi:uncharacterized protein THITE_2114795 [Thermothielavioides terrestris NRRL 8126]|uniref:Uncharacterized protein n=1 Tax=Thermothielavioides terrestris (strain ATCC 38088 / NRRL 8126) TaxID=578455 RepID=G2R1R1_THETT|nr:uncharacterized protein THITE_2114795 [Thermothielavioides terrestris NRRL 8126]AEO66603.1 hypothetical protein THITE_2114795 [Thermothielavioides terrestris NRRL 8126]
MVPSPFDPYEGGCPELRACVNLLVQNGADVNQADARGNAPLPRLCTAYCFRGNLLPPSESLLWITPVDKSQIVPLLLERGVNPEAKMIPVNRSAEHAGKPAHLAEFPHAAG